MNKGFLTLCLVVLLGAGCLSADEPSMQLREGSTNNINEVEVIELIDTLEDIPEPAPAPVTSPRTYTKPIPIEPAPIPIPTSNCDPNYSGCVPIASDVDCAGGSGDGPAYVKGPVQVLGRDIYRLDRNKDGWGCE